VKRNARALKDDSRVIERHKTNCSLQIIAARLDEMIAEDKKQLPHILLYIADEAHQRQLQTEDEEEDFLDESKTTFNLP